MSPTLLLPKGKQKLLLLTLLTSKSVGVALYSLVRGFYVDLEEAQRDSFILDAEAVPLWREHH